MYVLGVGVAGGMMLKAGSSEAGAGSADIRSVDDGWHVHQR